jgi:two-component system OmpR family sensor kinase
MRGGLFLKFLLSFWLTLLGIFICMWLAIEIFGLFGRGAPDISRDLLASRRDAPAILSQLADDVSRGAPAGIEATLRALPAGSQISIYAIDRTPPYWDKSLSREVTGPDKRRYLMGYRVPATTPRRSPLREMGGPLSILAIASLTVSIILAWYLTRPIILIRNGFEQLARGKLDVRLQPLIGRRRDEIASLARDFDGMAARLAQLVTKRDRLLHDVSHELRSPLSRMQLAIGLTRQDPVQFESSMHRIEREMARLDALVRELLVLARAESGLATSEDYFDPIAMLEVVADDARFEAVGSAVTVALDFPDLPEDERPTLCGSAELFRRALENIIRNALRFAPGGSTIVVKAQLMTAFYRFTILDDGPGVGMVDLDKLFDPFVKADQAGFGLGLAIAKRAVVAHGGTIKAANRQSGGFEIVIDVPVVLTRPPASTKSCS